MCFSAPSWVRVWAWCLRARAVWPWPCRVRASCPIRRLPGARAKGLQKRFVRSDAFEDTTRANVAKQSDAQRCAPGAFTPSHDACSARRQKNAARGAAADLFRAGRQRTRPRDGGWNVWRRASFERHRSSGTGDAGVGNGSGFARRMTVCVASKQAPVALMARGGSTPNMARVESCGPRCACKHRTGCCART